MQETSIKHNAFYDLQFLSLLCASDSNQMGKTLNIKSSLEIEMKWMHKIFKRILQHIANCRLQQK
jgi:hypothetical protein